MTCKLGITCWICCAALAVGCGSLPMPKAIPLPGTFKTDVGHERRERKQELLASFEKKRNAAQVLAATRRWEQGDLDGAKQDVLTVLDRDPSFAEAQELLARLETLRRPSETMLASYQAGEDSPLEHDSWVDVARRQPPQGKPVSAVAVNGSAATLDVARRALVSGDVDRASEQLVAFVGDGRRQAVEIEQAAALALQHAQPELAAHLAAVGLQRFPRSATLYRVRGAGEFHLGQYEAAQTSLQTSLSLDKSHPLSYFLLGLTQELLGNPAEASRNFEQAGALDPRYIRR